MESLDEGQQRHAVVLRDATGAWSAAVFVDAELMAWVVLLFLFLREHHASRVLAGRHARDVESRLGPARPRTAV